MSASLGEKTVKENPAQGADREYQGSAAWAEPLNPPPLAKARCRRVSDPDPELLKTASQPPPLPTFKTQTRTFRCLGLQFRSCWLSSAPLGHSWASLGHFLVHLGIVLATFSLIFAIKSVFLEWFVIESRKSSKK